MSAEAKKEVLIKVTDLKKHYNNGAVKALDGINAEIYRGEVVVIIGPSHVPHESLHHRAPPSLHLPQKHHKVWE